eukprot:sb/3475401/
MIELNNKSTTDILFNFQYTLEKLEVEQIVMERRDDICLKSLKEFKCNCRGPDPYWGKTAAEYLIDTDTFLHSAPNLENVSICPFKEVFASLVNNCRNVSSLVVPCHHKCLHSDDVLEFGMLSKLKKL